MGGGNCFPNTCLRHPHAVSDLTVAAIIRTQMNGSFPYPFLNLLPFPSGFIVTAVVSVGVFVGFFQLGALVKGRLDTGANRRQVESRSAKSIKGE